MSGVAVAAGALALGCRVGLGRGEAVRLKGSVQVGTAVRGAPVGVGCGPQAPRTMAAASVNTNIR
jgi:hypothetical protein